MQYRKLGALDWRASVLGFGTSLIGSGGGEPVEPDKKESIEIIRYAIDQGVNYLDLGYPYDMAVQERRACLVACALGDGYRERVRVAITVPSLFVDSYNDFDRLLNDQLKWLGADRVDFCLVGRLNRDDWPRLKDLGVLRWTEVALADGRIGHLGFSFHDHFQVLKSIVEAYDRWAFCQFQYSYMDIDHDPGVSGIKYAADCGLGVVVEEPLRSGRLTRNLPEPVARLWAQSLQERSLSEWGLRFVLDQQAVSTVLCDMSTREQVEEYVALSQAALPDSLTVQEEVLVSRVRDAYRKLRPIPCPSCRACMPCPQGIDVPRIFEIYNDAIIYDDIEMARKTYHDEQHRADACTLCGLCVKACAKRIAILDWLKPADDLLRRDK